MPVTLFKVDAGDVSSPAKFVKDSLDILQRVGHPYGLRHSPRGVSHPGIHVRFVWDYLGLLGITVGLLGSTMGLPSLRWDYWHYGGNTVITMGLRRKYWHYSGITWGITNVKNWQFK